ncbi:MAG: 50S ribosomal protein L5 [Nanoarchaeota archaeon]|nr:50S ribosomal protein L5 [Nanoarchaeota archaeon]
MIQQEQVQVEKQVEKKTIPIKIEKIVLNIGAVAEDLEKGFKLLKLISEATPVKTKSTKRIPAFGVRPGLETGCKVTLRKKKIEILKRLFVSVDNTIKENQIQDNHFSFGIHEYIEIPGIEYQREIGIMGFDVTVVFSKPGKRVMYKKMKKGKFPKRQYVTKQEIIDYLKQTYKLNIIPSRRKKK